VIVRVNDRNTEVHILPETNRDIMDLASVLHHQGPGRYELIFQHPCKANHDSPKILLRKVKTDV